MRKNVVSARNILLFLTLIVSLSLLTNVYADAGNSEITDICQTSGPGYNIEFTAKDPDEISSVEVYPRDSSVRIAYTTPDCEVSVVVQVTGLSPYDFPLQVYIQDCQDPPETDHHQIKENQVNKTAGVGGLVVPVDKLGLLAPYIGLASTILVATATTAIYVKRVKHRKKK